MADSSNGGGKGLQASLEEMSREELLKKCKQFLQFAQKAKKAKDKCKVELQKCTSEKDQLETLVQAKDRQLDRANQENDDLLQQVDIYSGQAKEFNKENADLRNSLKLAKDTINKLEKQSAKAMEYEANIICLKETEKQKSALVTLGENQITLLKEKCLKLKKENE